MDQAYRLIRALGGAGNIRDAASCVLRIRVEVAHPLLVREHDLRIPGVLAVVRSGNTVHIVVGTRSAELAADMSTYLAAQGVFVGTNACGHPVHLAP